MQSAPYTIYAVQYAQRNTSSSELFVGDHHNTPMKMAYFVWALTMGHRQWWSTLVLPKKSVRDVDVQFLRCPSQGLALLDIDCTKVEHVILSHFHYDHVGCYHLFPNATFYVQDAEMNFYTGRYVRQAAFRNSIEVEDVLALVRFNYEGRVVFIDGEKEIIPGISVHKVGGHTAGMQIVTVQTQHGRAVVASDASHYYHNFERTCHSQPTTICLGCTTVSSASANWLTTPI